MSAFTCLSVVPAVWRGAIEPALGTARAGGIPLLDLELCRDGDLPAVLQNLERLLALAGPAAEVGLRLAADQISGSADLLARLSSRPHRLVLCRWDRGPLAALPPASGPRLLLLEVTDYHQVEAAGRVGIEPDGWIARGQESGGWVGGEPAFILAQRLLAGQDRPVYVQGGIGLHTAAACRAAGAAGVVLDDLLLLLSESPLPEESRALLSSVSGQEAAVLGDRLGAPCRVLVRPDLPAAWELARLEERLEASDLSPDERAAAWRREAGSRLGWGDPSRFAWPAGQGVGLAAHYARRFRTTGRLVQAVLRASREHLDAARRLEILGEGSPLARSHGTRFPVVQGPMTRVSDVPAFAEAVARGGGLPFLALALLRGEAVRGLLAETRRCLDGRAWGAGILGFVPPELRAEQIAALRESPPPFVLIAGGRPDQAAQLESEGIPTYLHAPVPGLLKMFLEQGVRRFVFEGRECGGHIGPLTSFALWEGAVETLLEGVPPAEAERVHALFAGGVHDGLSAAMIAALAAPLAERGMKIGVLLGTAYLFTREAVASGAILEEFQRQALECDRTVQLQTGAGHAIRCAASPFAEEFERERQRMLRESRPAAEISTALEGLTLGRSRVASKGLARHGDTLEAVDEARQRREGMYMMGRLAALRSQVCDIEALHREIAEGSARVLARTAAAEPQPEESRPTRVAIIGIGCLLPQVQEPEELWRNVLRKRSAITEIPPERWDWRLYYDPDPAAPDRIYSKWGAFLDEVPFDPFRFGIPPRSLKSISASQLLTLEAVRRALHDAGYGEGGFDRERTSVILGNSGTADLHEQYVARSTLPLCLETPPDVVWRRLPGWTEESFPGTLSNVLAGRVASRFDLGGANYTVDAACASSLAALDLAVRELVEGRSDLAVTGGVDLEQTPHAYLAFSKTRAFSPQGKVRPFDRSADGIVIGEGVVILVLKRLDDALRDGDRVYAVIDAVAASSDGRSLSLTAPRSEGQERALDRAYRRSGIPPRSVGLYEAHGTGTAVGDAAELATITRVLEQDGAAPRSCAVGSVKSLIGHTKAAAGMAGLVKAALALHHRVLPPHAGVEQPLDPLADPESPVCLLGEPRPWLAPEGHPRRAAVSAFGFGGTNFHAVLEELDDGLHGPSLGGEDWPCELVVLRGAGRGDLLQEVRALGGALDRGARPRLRDLAWTCAERAAGRGPACLSIVAEDFEQLRQALRAAEAHLDGGSGLPQLPSSVALGLGDGESAELAFLFPGQGVQFPDMAREAALYFAEMREALELADRRVSTPDGRRLSQIVLPPACWSGESRSAQEEELADTRVAQPALGAVSLGYLALARRLGLRPAWAAGHSFGEWVALHAAGAFSEEDLLDLAALRGRLMAGAGASGGAMAAIQASAEEIEALLADCDDVSVANRNAPRQCVISGPRETVGAAVRRLEAAGFRATPLPVSGAFHTPLMALAREPLAEALAAREVRPLALPVYGNASAALYPGDPDGIRKVLAEHLLSPVDFQGQIRRMHRDGVRVFVEVGPRGTLTALVGRILEGEEHAAVALDGPGGGLRGLLAALGSLLRHGAKVDVGALFRDREVRRLDWDRLAETCRVEPPAAEWWVSGGGVRSRNEPPGRAGDEPLVNLEAVRRAPAASAIPAAPLAAQTLEAYRAYQETMRQFLALQEQVVTRFLGQAGSPGPAPATERPVPLAAPPAPAPQLLPPEPEPARLPVPVGERFDRNRLREILVGLVSERTGYPESMLDLHQDLEADLGVDSIKRIEILDSLQSNLPVELAGKVRSRLDALTRVKSLNGLVEAVLDEGPAGVPILRPAPLSPEPAEMGMWVPRYVMEAEDEPLPSLGEISASGLFLITEDGLSVARQVAASLAGLGARVAVLGREDLASPAEIERRLEELRRLHGPVQGIVHLAPLEVSPPPEDLAAWQARTWLEVKSLFHLVRLSAVDLQHSAGEDPGVVLGAFLLGGCWGRRGGCGPGSPAGAGCHGLLRTLESEYPGVLAKAVDFDGSLPPAQIARCVVQELLLRGGSFEVGYPAGRRTVFSAVPAPLATAPSAPLGWQPEPGWVVLVTGGARGITAAIAASLARPGVRMVIVGRSPEPPPEEPATAGVEDTASLRQALLRAFQETGEIPTPARVERRLQELLQERERRHNLDRLRRQGAEVEYHALDVRDEGSFGALLEEIYDRHGRLDAVVHGAGLVEDKLLADKAADSFDRVFDTKADSVFLLSRHLRPGSLKWVVLFSSIAGRVGNRGQADYAAANEVVNRLAWKLDAQWPSTRVVAINWGPWDGAGMAGGLVERHFRAQGIVPLAPEAGCRFFADELAYGRKGEVEVIAGEGPWKGDADPGLRTALEIGLFFMQIRAGEELTVS